MKKRLLMGILVLTMVFAVIPVQAEGTTAIPSRQQVTLNGENVRIGAYNLEDENYFKLRDLAALLKDTSARFNVYYSESSNSVGIFPGDGYQPILGDLAMNPDQVTTGISSPQTLLVDNDPVSIKAFNINDNNYYRLRDIARFIDLSVDYNANTDTVVLETDTTDEIPVLTNDGFNERDLYVTHIIEKNDIIPQDGIDIEEILEDFEVLDHEELPFRINFEEDDNRLTVDFDVNRSGSYSVSAYIEQEDMRNETVEIKDGIITPNAINKTSVNLEKPFVIHVIGIDEYHVDAPILEIINYYVD